MLTCRHRPGSQVRIRNGNFAGFEGTILAKRGGRILVAVNFMQQRASILLDAGELVPMKHIALKVIKPPGCRLRAFSEFIYSAKTYERVYKPTLDDIQLEHVQAVALNRKWKARWIHASGILIYLKTTFVHYLTVVGEVVTSVKAVRD